MSVSSKNISKVGQECRSQHLALCAGNKEDVAKPLAGAPPLQREAPKGLAASPISSQHLKPVTWQ